MVGIAVPDVDINALDDLYVHGMMTTMCQRANTPLFGRDPAEVIAAVSGRGPERLMDMGIRLGPWGDDLGRRPGGLTLAEVRSHPDGLRLAELEGGRLHEMVTTPSGKIELVHPMMTDDTPACWDVSIGPTTSSSSPVAATCGRTIPGCTMSRRCAAATGARC